MAPTRSNDYPPLVAICILNANKFSIWLVRKHIELALWAHCQHIVFTDEC